ncbi:sulfonate transport system substrate-binding protein [Arboricoccus pini]|uniref:Putative aliphatic sulfonates-binding protein n=1 Tax=Arboricoccus pini TaxID=1963835 RepID=A0A212RQS8_9PROT|nr:ABC transporter substrate-binding protein [Arboricoccus pini]SNB74943.1 sulfonate transport system substrate-binding protein [Arboricoccus pini]
MRRRHLLLAGSLSFLARPSLVRAATPLRIGDQRGGIHAMLDASGVLTDFPIPLQWSEFPAAAPVAEALNAGAIDIGYMGDAPFTFGAAAGVPMKGVLALREKRGGLAVVVPEASPARTFKDMAGKRIATGRGSIGHLLLLALLEEAGMQKDAVEIVFMTPADARSAFSSNAIDAWSTWEPYTSQLELEMQARIIGDGEKILPGTSFIAAADATIADRREDLGLFLAKAAKARAWTASHIDEYAVVWSKLTGLPAAIPKRWFERSSLSYTPIDAQVIEDEQRTIDLFTRNGVLLTPLKAADILDASFTSAISAP